MSITRYAGRVERVRMDQPRMTVVFHRGVREWLAGQMLEEVRGYANQALRRCEAGSDWGGYWVWHGQRRSRLYGSNAGSDSDRGRRMLQAVGSLS